MTHRLLLLAAALLFSTGGAAVKATTMTSWQVASFRSLIAAATLLGVSAAARRGWNWRVAPVGVTYAATLVLYVLSSKLTTAASAVFLQSTAPLYLLLLSPWLLGERIRSRDLLVCLAVIAGMMLVFAGTRTPMETAPDPARGNVLGALTGISWALTVTGLRWLGRSDRSTATVTAGNLIAFLAALPMALPVARFTVADLLALAYLGVFQIGLAYLCVARAIRHVPAFETTLLLMLEPALNPVWTWLVHGERPGEWAIAGGALILAATIANTWWRPCASSG